MVATLCLRMRHKVVMNQLRSDSSYLCCVAFLGDGARGRGGRQVP